MATILAPTRKAVPIRKLYGTMARALNRLRNAPGSSTSGEEVVAAQPEATPECPAVQVTSLGNKPVESGLAPMWGRAFSAEEDFPEGVVEAGLDDEDDLISRNDCERINSDLDALIASGVFRYGFKGQRVEWLYSHSELTRKSIVSHYFARGAASFYDSQGTPAGTTPPDDD